MNTKLNAAAAACSEICAEEAALAKADEMNSAMGCGFDPGRDQEYDYHRMQRIAKKHGFATVEEAVSLLCKHLGERLTLRRWSSAFEYAGHHASIAYEWSAFHVDCLCNPAARPVRQPRDL